jgi:hypothetical protein
MRCLTFSTLLIFLLMLGSCAERASGKVTAGEDSSVHSVKGHTVGKMAFSEKPDASATKIHNDVRYSVGLISALQFLDQKGEQVEEADREALSKESVLILTFNTQDKNKDVFESSRILMDHDQATQYLMGAVSEDISIEQDGKTLVPTGSLYEKSPGAMGQLRAFLYFNEIDVSHPAKVIYYDRLFGSGFMRFTVNK